MTDRELVTELLKRIADNRKERNLNPDYNKILSTSTGCISIENLFSGETIDFLFQKEKIMGIGS